MAVLFKLINLLNFNPASASVKSNCNILGTSCKMIMYLLIGPVKKKTLPERFDVLFGLMSQGHQNHRQGGKHFDVHYWDFGNYKK